MWQPCWALCVEVDATAEEGPELPCGAESATWVRCCPASPWWWETRSGQIEHLPNN